MSDLARIIAYKLPQANFLPGAGNVLLQDDGEGPYIKEWNEAELGKQPSKDQIGAWETEFKARPIEDAKRNKIDAMLAERGLTLKDLKDALAEQ